MCIIYCPHRGPEAKHGKEELEEDKGVYIRREEERSTFRHTSIIRSCAAELILEVSP